MSAVAMVVRTTANLARHTAIAKVMNLVMVMAS